MVFFIRFFLCLILRGEEATRPGLSKMEEYSVTTNQEMQELSEFYRFHKRLTSYRKWWVLSLVLWSLALGYAAKENLRDVFLLLSSGSVICYYIGRYVKEDRASDPIFVLEREFGCQTPFLPFFNIVEAGKFRALYSEVWGSDYLTKNYGDNEASKFIHFLLKRSLDSLNAENIKEEWERYKGD